MCIAFFNLRNETNEVKQQRKAFQCFSNLFNIERIVSYIFERIVCMMESRYYKEHSSYLDRDMEFKMYGYDGILCLIIPCQNGRFLNGKIAKCLI